MLKSPRWEYRISYLQAKTVGLTPRCRNYNEGSDDEEEDSEDSEEEDSEDDEDDEEENEYKAMGHSCEYPTEGKQRNKKRLQLSSVRLPWIRLCLIHTSHVFSREPKQSHV